MNDERGIMVTINHGVISLPSKPFSSASQTSSTKASTSSDAVSSTSALSSLSATQHSEWASQEYRQLQYDRPDGKHQKALSKSVLTLSKNNVLNLVRLGRTFDKPD